MVEAVSTALASGPVAQVVVVDHVIHLAHADDTHANLGRDVEGHERPMTAAATTARPRSVFRVRGSRDGSGGAFHTVATEEDARTGDEAHVVRSRPVTYAAV